MVVERGLLIVREKGGRKTYLVQLGDKPAMNVALGEVSQSLLSSLPDYNGKEVEFERVGGQPKQVREPGGVFVASAAPTAPAVQAQRNGRGTGPVVRFQSHPPASEQAMSRPKGAFHNPYNFVPAPPRNTQHPELGDHAPVAQDSFEPDRYTGTIRVRMVAKTPLLLPGTEKEPKAESDHKTFLLRVGQDGKPSIPASSVRGMLRSAFEAVTNSRFGRFSQSQHQDRLAFRMDARDGLKLIPARIEKGQIRLLRGTSSVGSEGKPRGPMYAAWLPRYSNGQLDRHSPRYVGENLPPQSDRLVPQHGDRVACWLELIQHYRKEQEQRLTADFQYWSVRAIARDADSLGAAPRPRPAGGNGTHQSCGEPPIRVEGWVCITNANINRKHDERVFFDASGQPPLSFPLNDSHCAMWRELIANYQSIHADALKKRREHKQPFDAFIDGKPPEPAWSRHVYTREDLELKDGTLCYVRLNAQRTAVEALFPVMIARGLYSASPWELLDESMRPASTIDELSPADRVFGWVDADADPVSVKKGSRIAARGLLRLGPVSCESTVAESVKTFDPDGVPLAILSTPKPQQGRFYVARTPNGEAQRDKLSKSDAGYSPGKGLRGRKVYPHQRSLPKDYWDEPESDRTQKAIGTPAHYQEYRRPQKDGDEQRDDQNRSILGWVKPGAVFSFDLHIHNLSKVELGALFWLLTQQDEHYFRFGGGKPLGFGSVRLTVDSFDVRTGEELCARYQSWCDEVSGSLSTQEAIDAFTAALSEAYPPPGNRSFDAIPFIDAFITASKGYADGLPVRYPRCTLAPSPEGESFKWFVANEKRENRYALADLVDDSGQPALPDPANGPEGGRR